MILQKTPRTLRTLSLVSSLSGLLLATNGCGSDEDSPITINSVGKSGAAGSLATLGPSAGRGSGGSAGTAGAAPGRGGQGGAGRAGAGSAGSKAGGGSAGKSGGAGSSGSGSGGGAGEQGGGSVNLELCPEGTTCECDDGIDNDGDGLIDWQFDQGCTARNDVSEGGLATGDREGGWTIYEPSSGNRITYVSADGNDSDDGTSPETAKRTPQAGFSALRDGSADWLLFRRGDSFKGGSGGENLTAIEIRVSGRSAKEPILVSSYGEETTQPTFTAFEVVNKSKGNMAMTHLRFVDSAITLGGNPANLTFEGLRLDDSSLVSGETPDENRTNLVIRRNVAALCEGPFFFAHTRGLTIEENVLYRVNESGGEGTHGMYIARAGNTDVVTRGNLVYYGDEGKGDGIKERSGGLAEGNVIAKAVWVGIHFGGCNDGNDSECEDPVRAEAHGNLLVEGAGIVMQHEWVSGGDATDNIVGDIPRELDDYPPIDAPESVKLSGNVELREPIDSSNPDLTIIGLFESEVLGGKGSTVDFFVAAAEQRKFNFNPEISAESLIAFTRKKLPQ